MDTKIKQLMPGELTLLETPKLYKRATKVLNRIKENKTTYRELNRTNLRGISLDIQNPHLRDIDFAKGITILARKSEAYGFALDPLILNAYKGESLGLDLEKEKKCDLLSFYRKFWIGKLEEDFEITKRRLFKENSITKTYLGTIHMDSPLPDPIEDEKNKGYILTVGGTMYIKRKQVQFDQPKTELIFPQTAVYPLYQEDLDELVELYSKTKRFD